MMKNDFLDKTNINPIIVAVNSSEMIEAAIKSQCEIIFLLKGSIFNLKGIVDKVKENGKNIYVHIDLMDGFSKDVAALKYICQIIKPDGIITTKSSLIKAAKQFNMFAIQRLFIIDSLSLETGINSVKQNKPDAIEIMPGIMPKVTKIISQETKLPIITGGLIKDKEDVVNSIKAGAIGISTSKLEIWEM